MKKIFSLIERSNLELQVNTRVIRSEEFSQLLDAKGLIEKAEQEIKSFREKAEKESIKLKEKAKKEGFEEGMKLWSSAVAGLEQKTQDLRKEFEDEIVSLVIECGKKIMGQEMKTSKTAILSVVQQALRPVATHEHITLYVNKEDLATLEEDKDKLKKAFEYVQSFAIHARSDVEKGGCIIETEAGIINAQLDVLWKSLEVALEGLLKEQQE